MHFQWASIRYPLSSIAWAEICTTNVCFSSLPFFVWIYHTFFSVFILFSLFYSCQRFSLHRLCIITYFCYYIFFLPIKPSQFEHEFSSCTNANLFKYTNCIRLHWFGVSFFCYLLSLSEDFCVHCSDECVCVFAQRLIVWQHS